MKYKQKMKVKQYQELKEIKYKYFKSIEIKNIFNTFIFLHAFENGKVYLFH